MKYNILSCPAFDKAQYECISPDTEHICCWMNEDCIMKQIVNKCKDYKEECKLSCIDDRMCSTCFLGGKKELAEDILDDLESEEVE